ncbi:MAG: La- protein 7, variant 2 [Marteilia pararefringens]
MANKASSRAVAQRKASPNQENLTESNKRRNRILKSQIVKQIMFYFSDENLRSSRFMQKTLERGEMTLSVLMSFNKLKELTQEKNLIIKALKRCSDRIRFDEKSENISCLVDIRQINDCDSQEIDERTLYIENLSQYWTIDNLREYFSKYGKVLIVNLPRFPNTKSHKGYAFVQFEKIESVTNALESNIKNVDESYKELLEILKLHFDLEKPPEMFKFDASIFDVLIKSNKNRNYRNKPSVVDEDAEDNDTSLQNMSILPKKDWKLLKNYYIYIQKNLDLNKKMYLNNIFSLNSIQNSDEITLRIIIKPKFSSIATEFHIKVIFILLS